MKRHTPPPPSQEPSPDAAPEPTGEQAPALPDQTARAVRLGLKTRLNQRMYPHFEPSAALAIQRLASAGIPRLAAEFASVNAALSAPYAELARSMSEITAAQRAAMDSLVRSQAQWQRQIMEISSAAERLLGAAGQNHETRLHYTDAFRSVAAAVEANGLGSMAQALQNIGASLRNVGDLRAMRIADIARVTSMDVGSVARLHGQLAAILRDTALVAARGSQAEEHEPVLADSEEQRLLIPVDRGIILVTHSVSRELVSHIAAGRLDLATIHHRLFEELIAELFSGFGYEVELTARTRDGGRDVVAVRHSEVNVKYLIECKRPRQGKRIGVRPIRELLGVKTDERASKAVLATTVAFTRGARELESRHCWELELRDYDGVMGWVQDYLRRLQ